MLDINNNTNGTKERREDYDDIMEEYTQLWKEYIRKKTAFYRFEIMYSEEINGNNTGMINKEKILQMTKEHNKLCSLEDQILNIVKGFIDENVIWIKGETGIRVYIHKESINTDIKDLNKNRTDRENLCCDILRFALRKDKGLAREPFKGAQQNPEERD